MASSSRTTTAAGASKAPRSPESYESLSRRNRAAEILQSYEQLSWYSFQRCESLVQTRLHFQNIVAGFTEEHEAALVDWKEDTTPRVKPGEESSMKGKERVGGSGRESGGGDGAAGSSAQKSQTSGKGKEKSGRDREKSAGSPSGSAKKKRKSGG